MSDVVEEKKDEVKAESPASPASTSEHMIPKSRLDEVLAQKAEAEKELKKLQDAEEKRKRDDMSEVERLKVEKADAEHKAELAENELKTERIKGAVFAEANKPQFGDSKSKFAEPEVAYKLLTDEEKSGDILEALKGLAANHPYLLDSQPQPKGDGVGSPRKGKPVGAAEMSQNAIDQKRRGYAPL